MRVLIFCPHYLPGYRSGGPVRSVACLVARLGDEIEFSVLTHCHDFHVAEPYPNVPIREWTRVGKANVMYLRDGDFSPLRLRKHILSAKPDAIYLNSFFHRRATLPVLILRRMGRLSGIPIVLAPRGEFSPGALELRAEKKALFLRVAKAAGLYKDILWQASSPLEREHIQQAFDPKIRCAIVHVAPDRSEIAAKLEGMAPRPEKQPGKLRAMYLGRISRKKNVEYALERLANLQGEVEFSIYGGFESPEYEADIRSKATRLPSNIQVRFMGSVPHDQAVRAFGGAELFLFPTRGENFGHVILESLAAGCPVLLSDQTPWLDLQQIGVGWDLPLSRPDQFEKALQEAIAMDHSRWQQMSDAAKAHALRITENEETLEECRRLFLDLRPQHRRRADALQNEPTPSGNQIE